MMDEFTRLLDTLPGLVWTALADGHADFVNARWCEYTGLRTDQIVGRGWQATIHYKDLPHLLERWSIAVASGAPTEMEGRLRRFDGEYRWFLFRVCPLSDATHELVKWCGISTDIDDRKRADQTLRRVETNLRQVCENIPGLVCTMSPKGDVDVLNRELLEYFGKTADDLRGWAVTDAVHPDDLPAVIAALTNALMTGTPYEIEHRCRRADGVYRWFNVRALPLRDTDGTIGGWFVLLTDIDDRKRAEDALRASERNLNLIINTIPALAWSALPDGCAEFLNQHYLDYVGMTLAEATGWGWSSAVHRDDLAGLGAIWRRSLASGESGEAEARLRRFDGEYRWFLFRVDPFRDESGVIVKWYGINTDIDDRKRIEHRLRQSEAFLAEGQRINQTGTFFWRMEPDEITFSEQLYRIFEFEPGSPLTVERIAARVHPDDLPLVSAKIELARRGVNDHAYDCRLRMPDGSVRYLRTNAFGSQNRDGRLEYIGAMQDVTERRLSEEALSKVRSELAHMTRVASLGALTASIAHEVNQPLAGIITNANTCLRMLAAETPNVDGARETARRTIRDANRASEVITRLRALFAKRDPGAEMLDLNEATREVIALSSSELQRARVVVRTELADTLPAVVGDRVQLQQVILNLLLNAAAAMSGVDDRPRQLTIRTEREPDGGVRMGVRDAGVGFDPQAVERLFEAFYTTKSSGMGLGLSVSRSIIESHQGRLWATPNEDHGATFWVSIPARHPAASESPPLPASGRNS